jgi:hypothetical protein
LVTLVNAKANASCGSIDVAKGDVKLQSGGKTSPAAVGSKICSGDTIIAGADSRAKIKMEDGNELNVSPDSQIVIENYQFNPAENKKKVLLNVLKGKVRATTKEENMYNDKDSGGQANTFQVKTKSAVAGVRGTDFLTGYDPGTKTSSIVTFRGNVEMGQPGPNGSITNSVHVKAGQTSSAVAGQAPQPPRVVPPHELNKLNTESRAETGGANTGARNGPNGGPGKNAPGTNNANGGPANSNGGSGGTNAPAGGSAAGGPATGGESSSNSGGPSNQGASPAASNGGSGGPAPASVGGAPSSAGGSQMVGGGDLTGDPGSNSKAINGAGGPTNQQPPSAPPPPLAAPPPPPPLMPVVVATPPPIPVLPPSVTNAISGGTALLTVTVKCPGCH